jgi:hypothetical protein
MKTLAETPQRNTMRMPFTMGHLERNLSERKFRHFARNAWSIVEPTREFMTVFSRYATMSAAGRCWKILGTEILLTLIGRYKVTRMSKVIIRIRPLAFALRFLLEGRVRDSVEIVWWLMTR